MREEGSVVFYDGHTGIIRSNNGVEYTLLYKNIYDSFERDSIKAGDKVTFEVSINNLSNIGFGKIKIALLVKKI